MKTKEYSLVDKEYASIEEAEIQVTETETFDPKVTTQITREIDLTNTIAILEQRKADAIAAYDAEIATNQELLNQVKLLNINARIV